MGGRSVSLINMTFNERKLIRLANYNLSITIKISSYFPIKHLFGYPGGKFWCVNTRILSGTRLSEISETAFIDDHTYAILYIIYIDNYLYNVT